MPRWLNKRAPLYQRRAALWGLNTAQKNGETPTKRCRKSLWPGHRSTLETHTAKRKERQTYQKNAYGLAFFAIKGWRGPTRENGAEEKRTEKSSSI